MEKIKEKSMQSIIDEANHNREQEKVSSKLLNKALARGKRLAAQLTAAKTIVVMSYPRPNKAPQRIKNK